MNEEERKKLVEERKRELARKELEAEIQRDVRLQEEKNELLELRLRHENKYAEMAIIFFGTMIPLYLFLFMVEYLFMAFFGQVFALFGIELGWIGIFLHLFVWTATIYSVLRKRSILEDIMDAFF